MSIFLVSLCVSQDQRQLFSQQRHSLVLWYFSFSPSQPTRSSPSVHATLSAALSLASILKALMLTSHQFPCSSLTKSPTNSLRFIPRWKFMYFTISRSNGKVYFRCRPVDDLTIVAFLKELLFCVYPTKNRLFYGTSSSQKWDLLVIRKQYGCPEPEYTVRQMNAFCPWLFTYFWRVITWSPNCCSDKLCRYREFSNFTSFPKLLLPSLEISRLRVAVSSLGEQKLVTLLTKSLREMLELASTLPAELVYIQSRGCSLSLMTSVSGMRTDGVYFDLASSFQKQAQGRKQSYSQRQLANTLLACSYRLSITILDFFSMENITIPKGINQINKNHACGHNSSHNDYFVVGRLPSQNNYIFTQIDKILLQHLRNTVTP